MRQIVVILPLLVGCRSCEERRAERTLEELGADLHVDTLIVIAEQVEREDGGTEAWGRQEDEVYLTAPAGWTLNWTYVGPAWLDKDCPDDVPLVAWFDSSSESWGVISPGDREGLATYAGGCDADGGDLRGTYDAGYTLDIEATHEDGDSYALTVAVPVALTIE